MVQRKWRTHWDTHEYKQRSMQSASYSHDRELSSRETCEHKRRNKEIGAEACEFCTFSSPISDYANLGITLIKWRVLQRISYRSHLRACKGARSPRVLRAKHFICHWKSNDGRVNIATICMVLQSKILFLLPCVDITSGICRRASFALHEPGPMARSGELAGTDSHINPGTYGCVGIGYMFRITFRTLLFGKFWILL